ncbi:MAG: M15 family metallopeptidase [Proteiniphilum sp.]
MQMLPMRHPTRLLLLLLLSCSCKGSEGKKLPPENTLLDSPAADAILPDTIVDACYSFEEAVAGTNAPNEVIDQLVLLDVSYLSVDGWIHKGQILCNKKITKEIGELFTLMLKDGFVIEKVVPIVRYGWNDSLSMADNNSYSFCYRDISYSQHANGMAIDINPRFNPLRWKKEDRPSQPAGAVSDTTVNGTLYPGHPVVKAFAEKGFRWGHNFSRYYDDHHFEKR